MYLERKRVCALLALSPWASRMAYNGLRPRRLQLLASSDVAALLNRSRRGGEKFRADGDIPQLMTADEVSRETGIPVRRLLLATRHRKNPVPHWRINKQTTRFSLASVRMWMEK